MQPGQRIGERFALVALAGTGGMAEVWRAEDSETGQVVAVKILSGGGQSAERFLREARVLSRLEAPGVVRYLDHGSTSSGQLYMAMDWLEGEDLSERLARGPLSTEETITLGREVARALVVPHREGIVHRDLKPSNIFLVDGQVRSPSVLDFGVALVSDATVKLTQAGTMMGTPGYMAPEQVRGQPDIDQTADVFSLGSILHECLTGSPVFGAKRLMAVLAKVLLAEAPRVGEVVPTVPAELDELVHRMLAKGPAARPADAAAVLRELEAISEGGGRPSVPLLQSLTPRERQVVSVVVTGGPDGNAAETLLQAEHAVQRNALETLADAHGAQLEALSDGTSIMVVGGHGEATDRAARAARCALSVRRSLPSMTVALSTGWTEASGRLPVAALIDRAIAQLGLSGQASSAAGVRIDEVTAGLLSERFEVSGDPKGLLLVAEHVVGPHAPMLLGRPTPCVGRERKLDVLEALVAACFEEPSASAVVITGEPGVGKSRVRKELVSRALARFGPIEVWTGRADPMRENLRFGLIADAILRASGILEGEDLGTQQRKLRARVALHVPPEGLQDMVDFIGEAIGVRFAPREGALLGAARSDPQLMGDQIRLAFRRLLEAECRMHPLVVVLEDLQWGDPHSLRLLESALRHGRELPLLVLGVARPEVRELLPKLQADWDLSIIRLPPLPDVAARELVSFALGDAVDGASASHLVKRSGGNLLHLEELIRAQAEGHGAEPSTTLLAMVQTRLERLPPELRRVLRAASVFGDMFWRSGVEALIGPDLADLDLQLDLLLERELIVVAGGVRAADRQYGFRDRLVREAAYAMLTDSDRRLGHRLAAEWLESIGSPDPVSVASHFEKSGAKRRAVSCWLRAAREALEAGDLEAAFGFATRGIDCGAQGEHRGVLRFIQAQGHWQRRRLPELIAAASEARELLPDRSPCWSQATAILLMAEVTSGPRAEVDTLLGDLLSVEVTDDEPAVLAGMLRAASAFAFVGRANLVDAVFAKLQGHCERAPTPLALGHLHEVRAWLALAEGNLPAFLDEQQASAELAERSGDQRRALTRRGDIAYGLLQMGQDEVAEPMLRAVAEEAQRVGADEVVLPMAHNLALLLARRGDRDGARATLARYCSVEVSQLPAQTRMHMSRYAAELSLIEGDHRAAARELDVFLELSNQADVTHRARCLCTAAKIHLEIGSLVEALKAAEEAMALLDDSLPIREGRAEIRLTHARVLHALGRRTEAQSAIRSAADLLLEQARGMGARSAAFLEQVPENALTLALAHRWS